MARHFFAWRNSHPHRFAGNAAAFLSLAWLFIVDPGLALSDPRNGLVEVSKRIMTPPRFPFTIDPKTSLADLLPTPPDHTKALLPWQVKDFGQVPEIQFEKFVVPKKIPASDTAKEELSGLSPEDNHKTMERIAHGIAKINHLNQKEADHFLKVLIEGRPDLQGLPFVMGDACRMDKTLSQGFVKEVALVHASSERAQEQREPGEAFSFHKSYEQHLKASGVKDRDYPGKPRAQVAALCQILGPRDKDTRLDLVRFLAKLDDRHATHALARLAVFSFEAEVRRAAIDALKPRPEKDATDFLVEGLAHPWPAVVENAGEVVVLLGRKDLVPQLLDLLAQPDPRAPRDRCKGKMVVREVVRVNHHRNCLLCHPPANTPDLKTDAFGQSPDVVTGAVPVPGQPFSQGGYNRFASPDIHVRADVTYLRQDFSLLQPVKNAAPWPDMQRFDFLVRERRVTQEEVESYQAWLKEQGPAYVSPHHRAIHEALRTLTGRSASEPTATAWRHILKD